MCSVFVAEIKSFLIARGHLCIFMSYGRRQLGSFLACFTFTCLQLYTTLKSPFSNRLIYARCCVFPCIQTCLIYFCKRSKNENTLLNLVFRGFPQTSIQPLISAILGIIDLSGFRSKVLSPKYFSESRSENLKLS